MELVEYEIEGETFYKKSEVQEVMLEVFNDPNTEQKQLWDLVGLKLMDAGTTSELEKLKYKLKCRDDELAEITANRPARWDEQDKRALPITLRLIAEIFKNHKIPFMLDLRNMRIKTGNCEKRLQVDTTPELLAVAGYYRNQIDQIHDRYIKHEKDFLEQKAWYEGELEALEAENELMQEQVAAAQDVIKHQEIMAATQKDLIVSLEQKIADLTRQKMNLEEKLQQEEVK